MFIRKKYDPVRKRTRIQVVKSVRAGKDGKEIRQKVVRHVGTSHEEFSIEPFVEIGREWIASGRVEEDGSSRRKFRGQDDVEDLASRICRERSPGALGVDLFDCQVENSVAVGLRAVMGKAYAMLGWVGFPGAGDKSADDTLRELVMARLMQPPDKYAEKNAPADVDEIALKPARVRKGMDLLDDDAVDRIRDDARRSAADLSGKPTDMLFCHCAALAFDTVWEDEGRLLLALIVTDEGLPVDYGLFPGKKWESETLGKALETFGSRHGPGKVAMVADAGMLGAGTRDILRKSAMPYVLEYRAESARGAVREAILEEEGYAPRTGGGGSRALRKEIRHDGERIVATWSPDRDRSDARTRHGAIRRLEKLLGKSGNADALRKRAEARYLKFPDDAGPVIDPEKIAEAAWWDGRRAVVARGVDGLSAEEILSRHRRLWGLGAHFRANEHDEEIRPVDDWTPDVIRAHVAICFMAYCCLRHVGVRLARLGHPMSPRDILDELGELRATIMSHMDTGDEYVIPGWAGPDVARILDCVDLSWNPVPFKLQYPNTRRTAEGWAAWPGIP